MKTFLVKEARYLEDYKIEILFNGNKKKVVDFAVFLGTHSHPQFNKYKKEEYFKKFSD